MSANNNFRRRQPSHLDRWVTNSVWRSNIDSMFHARQFLVASLLCCSHAKIKQNLLFNQMKTFRIANLLWPVFPIPHCSTIFHWNFQSRSQYSTVHFVRFLQSFPHNLAFAQSLNLFPYSTPIVSYLTSMDCIRDSSPRSVFLIQADNSLNYFGGHWMYCSWLIVLYQTQLSMKLLTH